MAKIINYEKLIDELLDRGVEKIYPSREELKKKLLSGERLRLYCGYDPSADALHIGNAISINKLGQFQKLGHEVIFLIGDFTGMIGDPTDKGSARQKQTREQVLEKAKDYQRQASAYLDFTGDNAAQVKYNSAWSDKLNFADLIELSSNFTVQQMIQRDMFQKRLAEEKPIYLHEFLYPLAQGNDSLAMDVDLEVGGNDQMFNMMCGRDLMKAVKKKDKFVLTMKLLADDSGKKMGKSEGNAVFLNEPAGAMYGHIMSWPDGVILPAFELCTNIPMVEISSFGSSLADGANPRDFKMRLAHEVVRLNHGLAAADQAQSDFVATFQKKGLPEEIDSWKAETSSYNILDLLVASGLADSKSDARRVVEQGGVRIKRADKDFETLKDVKAQIGIDNELIIQRGKIKFLRITK